MYMYVRICMQDCFWRLLTAEESHFHLFFVLVHSHMHIGACVSCFIVAEYMCTPHWIVFVDIAYLYNIYIGLENS